MINNHVNNMMNIDSSSKLFPNISIIDSLQAELIFKHFKAFYKVFIKGSNHCSHTQLTKKK